MRLLAICLLLLGCQGFETAGLSCSVPTNGMTVSLLSGEQNPLGCWRFTSDEEHGFLLYDPGDFSCDRGDRCVVVGKDETVWTVGYGYNNSIATGVDCSETCF